MKLEKFAEALHGIRKEFMLDSTDVLILNAIMEMRKIHGDVSTMGFVHAFDDAAISTTMTRIQALLRSGWIIRTAPSYSPRMKCLEPSEKVEALLEYLARI